MQKTQFSEDGTQSMHCDKMGALIVRNIKNIDISLDQCKKTIFQKVCTLANFGLTYICQKGSRQNC